MTRLLFLVLSVLLIPSCNNKKEVKEKTSVMTGCHSTQTTDNEWYTSGKKAPMFKGLEGIDFKISTASKEAQAYFNQGMMLSYAFNHAEAARSFYEAGRLDSTCAMAYWGYAYVLGPNYNAAMEDDNYPPAYEASLKALSLSKNCTPLEVSLIHALTTRYEAKAPVDRTHLDVAYAAAMKKVQEHTATDIMHQPEWGTLKILSVDTSLEEITIWGINSMADLVQIATKVLSGEIAAGQNRFDTSISLLKEAVELEDHLNYNEPPDWFFSVRHHLGAVLFKAGKYKEAEKVYREDLQIWKRNGWALIGLYHALVGQNKDTEAQSVKSDFDNAWQYADMELVSSSSISH